MTPRALLPDWKLTGILTAGELEAGLRVLRAVREPVCASVVLTWDAAMQREWVGLARVGYVETRNAHTSGPFRWGRAAATERGIAYLEQIEAAQAE